MKEILIMFAKPAIAVLSAAMFLVISSSVPAAEETETAIANMPVEELPGAKDNELEPFDEGRKCKRIRKTGSNRITRVCTTRAEREEANSASNEFLREQQIKQERYMLENADTGGISKN